MATSFEPVRADVVVIGGGGAGQRAALEAVGLGAQTILITKGLVGRSGNTPMGRFSFCVALEQYGNSPTDHAEDTLASGEGIADEPLVRTFVETAPRRLEELLAWKMRFEKTNGRLNQVRVPGHLAARALHFRQETGLEITRTMRRQLFRTGVRIIEDAPVISVLVQGDSVVGALAVDIWSDQPLLLEAPTVIIATGGAGCLYQVTSNAKDSTGDGYALAYEAGAELVDMEMTQFLPMGLSLPAALRGATDPGGALITAGAWLLNSKRERFMQRYDPQRMEFSTRAIVTRAIAEEVLAGRGTEYGGVWLTLPKDKGRASDVIERTWCDYMRQAGVDPDAGPIPVAPSCHYVMGGIRIDVNAAATISGLFAAGEVAGGLHGANRLAGNGLIDSQVFGAIAGHMAAPQARRTTKRRSAKRSAGRAWDFHRARVGAGKQSVMPWELKDRLAAVMTQGGGFIRTRQSLETALDELPSLQKGLAEMQRPSPGLASQEGIEARHLITTAEAVLRSALFRQESRGAHLRLDHPKRDDERFCVHVVALRDEAEAMKIDIRPVAVTSP